MSLLSALLICVHLLGSPDATPEWGFYSHRLINRLAVFTLPAEMIGLFKANVDYLSDHAVDPDKRRYATRHEAVRHYIDIDHWGAYPYPDVPRQWTDALAKHTEVFCVARTGDTTVLVAMADSAIVPESFTQFFRARLQPQYYEDSWVVDCTELAQVSSIDACDCPELQARETFSQYGILPYHLRSMQERLTRAFEDGKVSRILQLAAEFGHYIADAHVPLHTTTNYNGQLTDQVGIHAFWETRIPELFAEAEWDFFVGPADYIRDPVAYYWDIVLASNRLVDDVLSIEKELSLQYPTNAQFCFEERLQTTVRTQCAEYARAYHERMQGMVEERMRAAIQAIGSAWYTAWVDAGQPAFKGASGNLTPEDQAIFDELEREFRLGKIKGRAHGN